MRSLIVGGDVLQYTKVYCDRQEHELLGGVATQGHDTASQVHDTRPATRHLGLRHGQGASPRNGHARAAWAVGAHCALG